MSSRIEQIIEEIEEYIEGCKYQPLSTTKIIVNKEEIDELLRELRLKTPDEIKRYQKIISNKDAILEDAQQKADSVIAEAQERAQELVRQHEIMQQAYAQANDTINAANREAQEILDSATQDANNIRLSAITYTDDIMANIANVLSDTLEDAGSKYRAVIDSLQSFLNVINQNRNELAPQTAQAAAITGSYHTQDSNAAGSSDLNFDDLDEN
jgi:ABC-type transporter Mla subunit MlaD